jgi:hypothetical protein
VDNGKRLRGCRYGAKEPTSLTRTSRSVGISEAARFLDDRGCAHNASPLSLDTCEACYPRAVEIISGPVSIHMDTRMASTFSPELKSRQITTTNTDNSTWVSKDTQWLEYPDARKAAIHARGGRRR